MSGKNDCEVLLKCASQVFPLKFGEIEAQLPRSGGSRRSGGQSIVEHRA